MIKLEIFVSPKTDIDKLELKMREMETISLAVADMRLFGDEVKSQDLYRGVEQVVRHAQRYKIEIITSEEKVESTLRALKLVIGDENRSSSKVFSSHLN